jgi:L-arabinokinase
MTIVFYISGHGFGHATRTLAVIERIATICPDIRVVVRCRVPAWFIERSGVSGIDLQPVDVDTGIAQIDSLALDADATARRAAIFYDTFDQRAADEAAVIRALGADAVVGDVPPLAFAAAALAGRPSVALANFTWDWIYAYYPEFEALAPGVIARIAAAYSRATLALRMPFAGGFASMAGVTKDIPLVARRSRLGRSGARARLSLDSGRPLVLASFGGHSTAVPYEEIARQGGLTLILTDWEARSSGAAAHHLRRYSAADLSAAGVRYEDLVAAADVVVSKPGYGIVSECIANDTALLYTSRGAFAENDVMVEQMSAVLRCRFIEQDQLRAGRWQASIEALLAQPAPAERMIANGAEIAAGEILRVAVRKAERAHP